MTTNSGANLYTQGFGSRPENVEIPVVLTRDPTIYDANYPIGKGWVNTADQTHWVLVNVTTVSGVLTASWIASAGSSSVNTLSAEGGTHVMPVGGNFNFSGTTAGGYGSNGAIQFSSSAGEINAQVQVDGTTIQINGSNELTVPGAIPTTFSAESGAHIPASSGNFNISGSTAGGAVSNGAIIFSTVSPGEINAVVQVDGTSITINGSNKLQANANGDVPFTTIASSTLATPNTGWFAEAALTLTLPASPAEGNKIVVLCNVASIVVAANSGQTIQFGTTTSSTGGSLTSNHIGDAVTLYYRSTGSAWVASASMGNWTVA